MDLILNLSIATLSVIINENKTREFIAFKDVTKGENLKYRLSLNLPYKDSEMSLAALDVN